MIRFVKMLDSIYSVYSLYCQLNTTTIPQRSVFPDFWGFLKTDSGTLIYQPCIWRFIKSGGESSKKMYLGPLQTLSKWLSNPQTKSSFRNPLCWILLFPVRCSPALAESNNSRPLWRTGKRKSALYLALSGFLAVVSRYWVTETLKTWVYDNHYYSIKINHWLTPPPPSCCLDTSANQMNKSLVNHLNENIIPGTF